MNIKFKITIKNIMMIVWIIQLGNRFCNFNNKLILGISLEVVTDHKWNTIVYCFTHKLLCYGLRTIHNGPQLNFTLRIFLAKTSSLNIELANWIVSLILNSEFIRHVLKKQITEFLLFFYCGSYYSITEGQEVQLLRLNWGALCIVRSP